MNWSSNAGDETTEYAMMRLLGQIALSSGLNNNIKKCQNQTFHCYPGRKRPRRPKWGVPQQGTGSDGHRNNQSCVLSLSNGPKGRGSGNASSVYGIPT
uniref:Uncharacterized protein n=1 Tax=Arundo donax TaxID=35708 RepID=A0A0A9HNC1_ARUDO